MNRIDRAVITSVVLIVAAIAVAVSLSISNSVQKDREYDEWASQCHSSGRIIVNFSGYSHCLTWEEAKERGVEFETN